MKRLAILAAAVLWALPASAAAAERIGLYQTFVDIRADGTVGITEDIDYDFGDARRHGIYRDIPKTSEGGPRIVISDVTVFVDDASSVPTLENDRNRLRIRIGDPDATVSGPHRYRISYTVHNAVRYFTDRDEVYWNAVPDGFGVPIDAAVVTLQPPFRDGAELLGAPSCYAGPPESSETGRCTATPGPRGLWTIETLGPLAAGEGMTVAGALPVGIVARTGQVTESFGLGATLLGFLPLLVGGSIALIFFLIIFFAAANRVRLPRRRRDGGDIIVQYDPPAGITAAQAAYLAGSTDTKRLITAATVALAADGWLQMEFTEAKTLGLFTSRDITFHRQREGIPDDTSAARVLAMLVPTLQPVKLSDLKADARRGGLALHTIATDVRAVLIRQGILVRRGLWGMFTRPTEQGRDAMEHLAGLKIYLGAAEKRRLEFHNAPERNPQTFEKLLPYAIALGVDEPWRKAFEGILTDPPQWATGNVHGAAMWVALGSIGSDIGGLIGAHTSGTSGGGSSGGGSGGGGGGSW